MPRRTSPANAARRLEDILKWKLQPVEPRPALTAIRWDTTRPPTGEKRLPFPTDSVGTDGARGVETPTGADQWIELWAAWLSWTLDTATAKADGPWLLKTLHEHPDLHPLPDPTSFEDDERMAAWATGFLTEWDEFTRELTRLWWRLATLTGNAPLRRGLCPRCRTGQLQSQATTTGYTDTATCTHCRVTINYDKKEHLNSFRAAMRAEDIPADLHLTLEEIQLIWPRIKTSTLRAWVHRGHVTKTNGRYNLADINQYQWARK